MFEGYIEQGKYNVYKSGNLLNPLDSRSYLDIANMFSWGETSGSYQLAFAILFEEYGYEFAVTNYRDFQSRVIAKFPANTDFKLSKSEIEFWRKHTK